MVVISVSTLKEQAYRLIDSIPEEKMGKVLIILKNLKEIIDDELDELDLQLIKEAEKALEEGEFVPFEEVLKEAGINEKDLQDNH